MIQGEKRKSTYVSIFLDNLIVTIGEAVWGFVLDHELFYYTLKSIGDKQGWSQDLELGGAKV